MRRRILPNASQDVGWAEAQLGVPIDVILAIIGVETYYGKNKGVSGFDALATLGLDYPSVQSFF